MTKVIQQIGDLTAAIVELGYRGGVTGSVRQQVHDGDTIAVRADGNFGIRFLGVDAPEISFRLDKNSMAFISLNDPRWEAFLTDPFHPSLPPFQPALTTGLQRYLRTRLGRGTAVNHYLHAQAAEDLLEAEVTADVNELSITRGIPYKQAESEFRFFLAFANEILDRYGRFLGYINNYQPDETRRKLDYNGRMLAAGVVSPYFIWPNIDPFIKKSVVEAVIPPFGVNQLLEESWKLRSTREAVKEARAGGKGIFNPQNPLRLMPFEVRYLAERRPPSRWVIDLSKNDNVLIRPQNYFTIPNVEDRLYIPEEYVPLFMAKGWKLRRG